MGEINYNVEDIVNHRGLGAVIQNGEGILMQKHVKYGFWTIPVGKVKENSSVVEGLREEIYEECNIKVVDFVETGMIRLSYNRLGNEVIVNSYLFEISNYLGEIKNNEPEKHAEQKFLSLEKIFELEYVSDMTLFYLEKLGQTKNHDYDGRVLLIE